MLFAKWKELKELADDIRKRGLINPILVADGQILDGRNRLRACRLAGIKPRFRKIDRDLRERKISPLEYVVSLNLRRRHMSASQCAMAAATALPEWVEEGRKISRSNLMRGTDGAQIPPRGKSSQKLAKLFSVSPRYITAGQHLKKTFPDLAQQVFLGEITISRALRLGRVRSLTIKQEKTGKALADGKCFVEIQEGDMRLLLKNWDRREVDLILTDPPYAKEDLPLWCDLAKLAGKVLRPGGFLVALSGLQFIPQVIAALTADTGMEYYWTICLRFSGRHGCRHGLGVVTAWRPFLVFYKPPFLRPPHQVVDHFSATALLEKIHKWEQRPEVFEYLIKIFTKPGDFVLDPFAGSGAVLVASRSLGRHALGVEVDPVAVDKIRKRIQ